MRKIPATFMVLGHEVKVKYRNDLAEDCGCYGRWWKTKNLIELQTPGADYSVSFIMQTFWHEATHAMLDILGYDALSLDEELVDRLGQAIHQVLKTKKG